MEYKDYDEIVDSVIRDAEKLRESTADLYMTELSMLERYNRNVRERIEREIQSGERINVCPVELVLTPEHKEYYSKNFNELWEILYAVFSDNDARYVIGSN